MVISCNPDPDHKICDLIKDYYLDDKGYPIEERAGHVRYYVRHDGEFNFASSKEELAEQFDIPEDKWESRILSFTFIPMTIKDNPILQQENPEYEAFLQGLEPVEKARLYFGNWFARPQGSNYFKREWLRGQNGERVKTLQDIPEGCIAMRAVDKAHTEPSEKNKDPDFTALSPLMLKDRNGFYWLLGNFHPLFKDTPRKATEKTFVGRVRKLPGERDNLIAAQMKLDITLANTYKYSEPRLVLAKDSGGGASDYLSTVARMAEERIKVEKDQTISNVEGKKLKDFLNFTKAAQNGIIYIVEETFEPDSLEAQYKELEAFDGEDSTRVRHDDWVDGYSMCFNAVSTGKRPYQTLVRNQQVVDTLSANLYKS
jgi:phage terminase large subunit-like protein